MVNQATVLVDDEPDLRELYAASLSGEYAVRTAASGRDALDRLDAAIERDGDETLFQEL